MTSLCGSERTGRTDENASRCPLIVTDFDGVAESFVRYVSDYCVDGKRPSPYRSGQPEGEP